ncbi:MAG: hypothetical protein M3N49_10130 [Candidatus Eremiobacteraeota bacterium]|nr:hypothetical protein [Candidatus Eremiobacteraeota bacterium]
MVVGASEEANAGSPGGNERFMRTHTAPPGLFTIVALVLAAGFAPVARAAADEPSAPPAPAAAVVSGVAAGTRVRFHVDAPLSSATSKTGETFTFTLLDPLQTTGERVIPAGTKGSGTLLLAGHAGSGGHEGDLTLRLDTLDLGDGHALRFDNQRFEVNGRNRKAASSILGFVPIVGYAAMFMRGSDVRIDPGTPIETVLARGALISDYAAST